ncbi:hypothetical protein TNCV_2287771 [Trichonephila clavipes]|nr:hypothetical protein TNCV_2287771 [Trichonephila clavipes]
MVTNSWSVFVELSIRVLVSLKTQHGKGLMYVKSSGVTENIRATLQTQVLGPKPKYVLSVSQALDPIESQPRNAGVAGVYVTHWLNLSWPKSVAISPRVASRCDVNQCQGDKCQKFEPWSMAIPYDQTTYEFSPTHTHTHTLFILSHHIYVISLNFDRFNMHQPHYTTDLKHHLGYPNLK